MGNVDLSKLENYIVVSLVGALGKIEDVRELDQLLDDGVHALWSDEMQSVVAFVFEKNLWNDTKARAWVKDAQSKHDVAAAEVRVRLQRSQLAKRR